MDWGLAKVLHSGGVADEPRPVPAAEDQVQTARSGSDRDASRAGSVLGTPAYMPPEQARGQVDAIDERADVFALGAMLCEVLTGAPPYQSGTYAEMHRMAAEANLAQALDRLRSSGGDAELIELALRCLAPTAGDRLRDAGEVSRATTAYLAGVQDRLRHAEIESAQAQARAIEERKRRQTQFRMAAGILVALLAGIAGVATQWSRAEENLKKSEARLRLANEAIERFYTGASEDVLLKEPQLKALREKLLGSALEFYKKLQASLEGESAGKAVGELAAAYERVGEITAQIGSQEAALDAVGHARAIRQRLSDLQPRSETAQESFAAVLERESDSLMEIGRTAESLQSLEQARAIRERLANEHPDVVRDQINLARTDCKLGNLLGFRMNRNPEALETLQRAAALYNSLVQQSPAELPILRGLGEVLGTQGTIAQQMGNTAAALDFAQKAESIYKQIISKYTGDLDSREKLGRLLMNHGYRATILNMKDPGHLLQQGVEIFRQLAADRPNVSRFQFHLGRARQSLAWWLRKVKREADALKEFQEALKLFDRLALEHPSVAEYSSNLCMCLTNLADVMQDDGRLDESSDFLRRAQEIADRLVAQNPNVDHYQTKRADIQMVVAWVELRKGKKPEAEEAYERAAG